MCIYEYIYIYIAVHVCTRCLFRTLLQGTDAGQMKIFMVVIFPEDCKTIWW